MKFFLLFSCLVFVLGASAQNVIMKPRPLKFYRKEKVPISPIYTQTSINKVLTTRINQLALTLDDLLTKGSQQYANILISPINIMKTLSVLMLGSAGKTQEELVNTLGFVLGKNLIQEDVLKFHHTLGTLLKRATSKNSDNGTGSNLEDASGIFVQTGNSISSSFQSNAREIYNSEIFSLDFSGNGDQSAEFINEWVSNKTRGRILQIVEPPLDSLTKAVIAGALFFIGNWESPFLEQVTKWQPFYLSSEGKKGKDSVLVQLMVNFGTIPYYEDTTIGYQAIGLPYKNSDEIMYIVLPKLKVDLKKLLCSFTHKDLAAITSKSALTEAYYIIPKMKLDFQVNLRETLQRLNVTTLFNPQTADFSNLADGVYASDIIHKVDMDINEKGTIAAAATAGSVTRGGHLDFRADRPFAFFIYNVKLGLMTFWGSIKKPTPFKPNN